MFFEQRLDSPKSEKGSQDPKTEEKAGICLSVALNPWLGLHYLYIL